MSDQVRLLLCLSSQPSYINITERHIRNLVDPIASAAEIRLLSGKGDTRALLRLANQAMADRVAQSLHGITTSLGRVGIYDVDAGAGLKAALDGSKAVLGHISLNTTQSPWNDSAPSSDENGQKTKTRFILPKRAILPPVQLLPSIQLCGAEQGVSHFGGIGPSKSALKHDIGCGREEDKQHPSGTTLDTVQTGVAACFIEVTHPDGAQMTEKKVLKAFRRFGRIFNMRFDENKNAWLLQYGSDKEVRKVAKVLANNKLFGYVLQSKDEHMDANAHAAIFGTGFYPSPASSKDNVKLMDCPPTNAWRSTLRIDFSGPALSLDRLCLAMARVHKPLEVSACLDPVRNRAFALARFTCLSEAAEVLMELGRTSSRLRARFAD